MNGYIKRGEWIAAALLGCLVLSLSAQGASFECGKAETKVEHLICDNPEISKLDDELSAAYKTALQNQSQAEAIKLVQKQWMKERNGCGDEECVKRTYKVRLSSLALKQMSADHGAASIKNAKDESYNGQQYYFRLTKGKGVQVCDAYLERLNATKYVKPPYCDRPENDTFKGFARLNRVSLSPADVHDLNPIIWAFMGMANKKDMNWTDANLQQRLTETGQFRLSKDGLKDMQMDMDGGWTKIWRYDPPIDIDNDGTPDNVDVWHGYPLRGGVGGRVCGDDMSDKFSGETSLRQPQIAFVVSGSNDRLDVTKMVKIFAHPSGGYRLYDNVERKWKVSDDFHPIGDSMGIFKYQNLYYFDTFFDNWGDFESKRQKDKRITSTLAVFLHQNGETRQVCEYLMTDNGTQNGRGTK